MAEGSKTFEGLAVPLFGECSIQQDNADYDIVTLTAAADTTTDFIVCQHSTATTEKFVIGYDGAITTLGAVAGASVDVSGQVEAASLAVTGIGTFNLTAQNVGTASFTVAGLATTDAVILSPREPADGACVVALVAANALTIRNIASEAADVEFNYLVIGKT